jgi:hypothetical protein
MEPPFASEPQPDGQAPGGPMADQAEGSGPINPNPLSSLKLENLGATLSLPLFTPSRTAPTVEPPPEVAIEAPVEPQPEAEQPPPAVQLVGIVLTGSTQTALLLDSASNEIHRLNSGDDFNGWALQIVDARSVELRSGDRVQGLKMFEKFAAPPPGGMMRGEVGELYPTELLPMPGDPPPQESGDLQPGGFEPQARGGAFPPDAPPPDAPLPDVPPAADFAPDMGGTPIPEEGALPPEGQFDPAGSFQSP